MTGVVNFAFEEQLVRVVERDGEPWFVGNDVCRALGLSNPRKAVGDLDDDERGVTTGDTLGGEQVMNIVSEAGVYRLVFRSRKPEAERFKRWLAHEVLPAIRKTGRYGTAAEPLPDLDNSSVAVWRAKIDLVREARIQFGAARARLLWARLGLPEVPLIAPETVRDDGPACLAVLMAAPCGGATVAALLREDPLAPALLDFGIRAEPRLSGFYVATAAPAVLRLFMGTAWADGSWIAALRSLPGAARHGKVRFGALQSRATFLPLGLVPE